MKSRFESPGTAAPTIGPEKPPTTRSEYVWPIARDGANATITTHNTKQILIALEPFVGPIDAPVERAEFHLVTQRQKGQSQQLGKFVTLSR
jgi:hypothetical protein